MTVRAHCVLVYCCWTAYLALLRGGAVWNGRSVFVIESLAYIVHKKTGVC